MAACQPTTYVYDESGRLRSATAGDGTVAYTYDASGNVVGVEAYASDEVSVIELSPDHGAEGAEVVVHGTGFSATAAENTVTFNGTPATITKAAALELTVVVPPGATTGAVEVTAPNGAATSVGPFTVQPDRAPTITGVSPTVVAPGETLTVTGSNFATEPLSNVVTIGETYVRVSAATSSELSVVAPSVAAAGPLSVATADGTVSGPADVFVVPPPYTPADVDFAGRGEVDGAAVPMVVDTADKVGVVAFAGEAGQRVSVSLTDPVFTGTQPEVWVYGPVGEKLERLRYLIGSDVIEPMTLPMRGTYTVVVDPTADPAATGSVGVQLFDVADIEGEIVAGGAPVPIDITDPGQNASFTFQGVAGQTVSAAVVDRTDPTPCCTWGRISIVGPTGSRLMYRNLYNDAAPWLAGRTTLPADGTYRLVVDPTRTVTGSLTVQLYDVVDVAGSITVGGDPVAVDIATPGQAALLTFDGVAGQTVSATVVDRTDPQVGSTWGEFVVLGPDGTELASRTLLNQALPFLIDRVDLPADGTYTLAVRADEALTGSATVQVHNVVDAELPVVVGGDPVSVDIVAPGQTAALTFDGTAGQEISAAVLSVNAAVPCCEWGTFSLIAPDGTNLGSRPRHNSQAVPWLIDRVTLPADGTYRLIAEPKDAVTGTASVQVYEVADLNGTLTVGDPPVPVVITTPAQDAYYTFEGTAGDDLTVEFTGDTLASCSPTIRVYTPDETRIAIDSCVIGQDARALGALSQTGTYRVEVDPSDATTGTVNLQVVQSAAAQVAPAPEVEATPQQPIAGAEGAGDTAAPDVTAAAAAPTAISGEVRDLAGQPVAGVAVSVDGQSTTTGSNGAFLLELSEILSGHYTLVVDGRPASQGGVAYGTFEIGVDLIEGTTTDLGATVWLPALDTASEVTLAYPLTQDVVVTSPDMPGLEVQIPAGSEVRDRDGNLVNEIGITAIPADKPPFPLAEGASALALFTVQPAGVTVSGSGARVVYPNPGDEPPGAWVPLHDYSPDAGWSVYGTGEVSSDGDQIVPGAGAGLTSLSGIGGVIAAPSFLAPPEGMNAGSDASPVDLATGLFTTSATDLVVNDITPLSVTRTYRHDDTAQRAFGIGWSSGFDAFLYTPLPFDEVQLILSDGVRLQFDRIDGGSTVVGSVFEHTSTPTPFQGAQVRWTPNGWDLVRKDGTTFRFGDNGYLAAVQDPTGKQVTFRRERRSISGAGEGNIVGVHGPFGRSLTYSYDAQGRVTAVSDDAGRSVGYAYDADGRLETVTDPTGGTIRYGYDSDDRLVSMTDQANTTVLTNEYGTSGRVSRQVLADGSDIEFAFQTNADGQVTQTDVTAPDGTVRRVTFDAGYWVTDTAAVGTSLEQTVSVERHPTSRAVTATVDHVGRRTEYVHDARGNVTSATALAGTPGAVSVGYTYDPRWNRLATTTDPLGRTVSYTYDDAGNLDTVEDPAGAVTNYDHDRWGRTTSVIDALGNASTVDYDLLHRITTTDPLGRITSQFFDAAGRTGAVTDAAGNRGYFAYDGLDRLLTTTGPDGSETGFTYDTVGNLESFTDPRGNTTSWVLDDLGRVTERIDPLRASETMVYDAAGRLTEHTDRRGKVTGYDYDALGRPTSIDFGVTDTGSESTIGYTYDAAGRLSAAEDSAYGTIGFTYDDLDRVTTETSPQGQITHGYNTAGERTSLTITGGPTTNYTYDGAGRLATITQGALSASVTRDILGRPTTATLPNGVTSTYEIDAAGQLTKITYDQDQAEEPIGDVAYTYGPLGQRLTASGSLVKAATPDPVSTATHDAANRVTEWNGASLTYDAAGNLTGDGTNTYTWNARGELTGIDGPVDAEFTYDPFGRRTSKVIGTDTTGYQYDGPNIVGEQHATAGPVSYLTIGVDEVLARTANGTATTYLADGLGSTVGLVDPSGTVATTYGYAPFGQTEMGGTADPNPFAFAGRELDETGLYYNRARYYSPELARFISEDPIGLASGEDNLFAYAGNSPTNLTDPSGLCATAGQALGLLGDEFAMLGDFMLQSSGLNAEFKSGAISSSDYSAGLQSAYSAIQQQLPIAVAANCGIAFAGMLGGFGPAGSAPQARALPRELTLGRNANAGVDVYHGVSGGKPVYTGITNNLERRAAQHGSRFDDLAQVTSSPVTRGEARAIEEALIVRNRGQNLRHEISPSHPWYDDAVGWGEDWLTRNGF